MKDKSYLEKNGDCLYFSNKDEFELIIDTFDTTVPTKGQKSFHRERYCIVMYLKNLVENAQVDFPYSICKADPLDFILSYNDRKIGIEHRDVTSEEYRRDISNKKRTTTPIFLDRFKKSGTPNNINNSGWVGDGVEQEWAELVVEAISDKVDKLNKGHYPKLDPYELLLYSNTYIPNIDLSLAGNCLSKAFDKKLVGRWFDRLYSCCTIIYGTEVWRTKLPLKEE